MSSKKGEGTTEWNVRQIGVLVFAIIIVLVIIIYPTKLYSSFFENKEGSDVKKSFESLIVQLRIAEAGEDFVKTPFYIEDKYRLVNFDKETTTFQSLKAPSGCALKECLVICNDRECSQYLTLSAFENIEITTINNVIVSDYNGIANLYIKKESENKIFVALETESLMEEYDNYLKEKNRQDMIYEVPSDFQAKANIVAKYESVIMKEAENTGVPMSLIKAVIARESSGNEEAISYAGAVGLMQLLPGTATDNGLSVPDYGSEQREITEDGQKREITVSRCNSFQPLICDNENDERFNAEKNIMAGTRHLKLLLSLYNGDLELTLAAYNAGQGNVEKYGGIPPFKQTQEYVPIVLGYKQGFDDLA